MVITIIIIIITIIIMDVLRTSVKIMYALRKIIFV